VLVRLSRVAALVFAIGQWTVLEAASPAACDTARADRLRATAAYGRGDLPSAIIQLRQAIQSCPTESFFNFMLANALYRAGELKDSAAAYQAFLVSAPGHVEAHMSLGFALFELGDRRKAIDQWTIAEKIEPESPFARAALAVGFYAVGDMDNALVQYQHAIAVDARYAHPEALSIDIRWKPAVLATLAEVKRALERSR
jgi:tetratricopeptide (TPR) repeat protein